MAILRRSLRRLAAVCRGIFAVVTPFVASNATVRNNQFVSLFFLLFIFLSCVTLMVNGLVSVRTPMLAVHVQHQYEYAIFFFVLLELCYWFFVMFRRRNLSCSCHEVRWRLSQDFGGFICCADIPEYKKNHLQNHLLYGSIIIALIISSYCIWLFARSILLYTCSPFTGDLSFYAVAGDCLMSLALIFHIWLQLVVAFYYRKGKIQAVCHTLSAIIWLIALNFVLYLQIMISEALEVKHSLEKYQTVHHSEPLERCRSLNSSNIEYLDFLERHHKEWVRPLGYALTVEFVLTLNTVFLSLWYHAKDAKNPLPEISEPDDIIEISIDPAEDEYAVKHDLFGEITIRPDKSCLEMDSVGEMIEMNHRILLDVNCRKYSLPAPCNLVRKEPERLPRSATNSRTANMDIDEQNSRTIRSDSPRSISSEEDGALNQEHQQIVARIQPHGRKSQVSFASGTPTEDMQSRWNRVSSRRRRSVAVRKDFRNIPFLGVVVGAVVCSPLLVSAGFAYTISKNFDVEDANDSIAQEELAFSATMYEAAIMITQAVISFLCSICLMILSKLTPSRRLKIHEKIDIVLLLITMTGMMTLSSFAMSALMYPWAADSGLPLKHSRNLKVITGFEVLLGVIQVFLQTMFIAKAFATESTRNDFSYLTILGFRLQRKRLGKILTELSMLFTVYSVLMWFINAFYERRSYSMLNRIATKFYPKEAWFAVTEVTYPMSICYYYHSMICFIAIVNKFASPW